MWFKKALFVFFVLISFSSSGKIFRSPYVMFELEDTWVCKDFGVNWVCHNYLDSKSAPAFILTTARMASSSEKLRFDRFEKESDGSFFIRPAKKVYINRHVWIDSFYKDRFYRGILSRYQRTVCCKGIPKFQVLVGFHAFKENYPQYASSFLKAIRSLSLQTSNLKEIMHLFKKKNVQQKQEMNNYIQKILFEETSDLKPPKQENFFYKKNLLLLTFWLSFFLAIFFILYYKKDKKNRLKNQKRK